MRPRVAYWNNIPAPYVVDRFNAVARRGDVEFEAWFSYRSEPSRSWRVEEDRWEFRHRFLPSVKVGEVRLPFPAPLLARESPGLLISLYGWPWFVVGWSLARARGSRVAFECEVTFERWIQRRGWKEAAKRFLFPRLDAVVTVGEDGEAYARRYGADPDRLFRIPHSIGRLHFEYDRREAEADRDRVRSELGLRGTVFVYVGRLWWGKGLDGLLDAYRELRRSGRAETTLLLVGDGEDELHLRERCRREEIEDVVFAGFLEGRALLAAYVASDVFVFPTLGDPYGLVIEEAMAAGLPVVSTSAAGEIRSRVRDGETGFVVPPDDSRPLRDRMELLLEPQLRRRLGAAAAASVVDRTPERWAERFEHAVREIMSLPRARR